jgi:tetratricopeptide (TPR) repeat protein
LNAAAAFARAQGDPATAQKLLEESLALCRELNEPKGMAYALVNLAIGAMDQGRYADAEARLMEALTLLKAIDDRWGLAITLGNLGKLTRIRGDHAAAVPMLEEALRMVRETGDLRAAGEMLYDQGRAECALGKLDAGEAHFTECLTICRDLGDRGRMAEGLDGFAHLAIARESPSRAAQVWGAAERLREEIGVPLRSFDRVNYESALSATRAALGDDAFERAWREGREMTLEDAVKYALSAGEASHRH